MTLDEQDLRDGLKFIVGKWRPDYIVNAFSNDLAHIPASEFKSDDGRDFTALEFSFFEDHTAVMTDSSGGKEENGVWEQTGWAEYHYTLNSFLDIPDGDLKKSAETLSRQDDHLVFGLGFLAVALKKIEDGTVTEEPDVGDLVPTAEDEAMKDIVGCYEVVKTLAMVGGDFGLFTRDEVYSDLQKRKAAGEIDDDEIEETMRMFCSFVEFTDDHIVKVWMKLPNGLSDEDIREALESGEVKEVRDGYFSARENEWKYVKGAYYYNTNEHREVFDEVQSPWDELTFDDEGLMNFGSGSMKLKRK